MSRFLALFVSATISASAFAGTKQVSFATLQTAAVNAAKTLRETGEDCEFKVINTSTGIRLFVGSTDGDVFVHFPKTSNVTLTAKEGPDGSYVRTYTVKNVGTFTVIHDHDAQEPYEQVNLHSAIVDRGLSCGVIIQK